MTSFPATVQTSHGRTLRLGKQLGKGGEGAVYEAKEHADFALKLYWPNKAADRRDKVTAMVSAGWHKANSFVAFPVDVIYAPNGTFLGFLMKKIGGHKPAHLLFSPASRKAEFATAAVNFRFLIRAATNACRAVASVHATGCVIGDVNHSGFLVSENATITLIDSDSFQVASATRNFLCKVGTPEYTPPDIQGQKFDRFRRTSNHDSFGLAVLIFQLLFMGRHPFSGRFLSKGDMPLERAIAEYRFAYSAKKSFTNMEPPPNVPLLSDFPSYIADAFEQAFGRDGLNRRPSAEDWISLLGRLESELQPCSVDQAHHHVKGKPCAWCRMERATPGFLAFVSTQQQSAIPLHIDVSQLLAILNGIRDPGPTPHIQTALTRLPSVPSQEAISAISEINRRRAIGLAASLGGVLFMQIGSFGVFGGLAMVGAGAFAILHAPDKLQKRRNARKQAQSAWKGVQDAWNRQAGNKRYKEIRSEIEVTIQQLKKLPEEEKRGLDQLEQKKRERQLTRHLEHYRIADHKIRKIGSGRKAVLASYGIETAADITQHRVSNVQGFGPMLIGELMTWRRSQEQKFIFRPNEPLNPADLATLKATINRHKAESEGKIRSAISNLQNATNFAISERKSLTLSAQRAFEQLNQTDIDEKAGIGRGHKPAKYGSIACIALALFTLFQAGTGAVTRSTPAVATRPPDSSNAIVKHDPDKLPEKPGLVPPAPGKPPIGGPYVPVPPGWTQPRSPEWQREAPQLPDPTEIPSAAEKTEHADSLPPNIRPLLDLTQKEDARRVQQRLIDLKFLEGVADGIWGPKSRKALSEFRVAQELGQDDIWNDLTQRRLFDDLRAHVPTNLTFLGVWTPEAGQCGNSSSVAPVRITSRHAESRTGKCDFDNVQEQTEGSWSIRARCSAGDSSWPANITLTRVGSQLIWKSEKGESNYYACSG